MSWEYLLFRACLALNLLPHFDVGSEEVRSPQESEFETVPRFEVAQVRSVGYTAMSHDVDDFSA